MGRLSIDVSALPDITQSEMDFLDSSFFRPNNSVERPQLPSPSSIVAQYGDGGTRIIRIDALNMIVKIDYTNHMRLEEVQTMLAIRQLFSCDDLPVPEVFGWRLHGHQLFIYMSLIRGETLRQASPRLTQIDKISIQSDISRVIMLLRQIVQENPKNICMVIAFGFPS